MLQLLSPKAFGQAIGVSDSSLKRWVDSGRIRAARTAGGHRRIELSEALRFIRDNQLPVIDPSPLGLLDIADIDIDAEGDASTDQALMDALIDGEARRARGLLMAAYLRGEGVADLCDGPIAHAMHKIGELWKHDAKGIFIEHRATDICLGAMNLLRGILPPPQNDAPLAIGGAPEGDPYMMPSLMAAVTLADAGWRESNLGADTPWNVMNEAAKRDQPRLIWISSTTGSDKGDLVKSANALAEFAEQWRACVVLGGQAVPSAVSVQADNLHIVRSMNELAAFARGIRASTSN